MSRVLAITVAIVLLAIGSWWLHEQSRPDVRAPKPLRAGRHPDTIFAPGVVEGAFRELGLRCEVAGRIEETFVKEGDIVEAGHLLLRLDDRTQQQQVAMLTAQLQLAEAQLQRLKNGAHEQERLEAHSMYAAQQARLRHAEGEFQRADRLLQSNAIGVQEFDRLAAEVQALTGEVAAAKARLDLLNAPPRADDLQAAEARVLVARSRVDLAKTELARTRLHAPARGQILELHKLRGETVDLDDPQPVLVMADTSRKRVRAYVEELDALRVLPGMKATITADGLPGVEITGELVEVLPRMSFKQVWSDRPDERFDHKTREVLIDLRGEVPFASARGADWPLPSPTGLLQRRTVALDGGELDGDPLDDEPHAARGPTASAESRLVFGLLVEVRIDASTAADTRQAF